MVPGADDQLPSTTGDLHTSKWTVRNLSGPHTGACADESPSDVPSDTQGFSNSHGPADLFSPRAACGWRRADGAVTAGESSLAADVRLGFGPECEARVVTAESSGVQAEDEGAGPTRKIMSSRVHTPENAWGLRISTPGQADLLRRTETPRSSSFLCRWRDAQRPDLVWWLLAGLVVANSVVLILCWTLLVAGAHSLQRVCGPNFEGWPERQVFLNHVGPALCSLVAAPGAVWLARAACTPHIKAIAGYAMLNWVHQSISFLHSAIRCSERLSFINDDTLTHNIFVGQALANGFLLCAGPLLAMWRMMALEKVALQNLGMCLVHRFFWLGPPLSIVAVSCVFFGHEAAAFLLAICVALGTVWLLLFNGVLIRTLVIGARAVACAPVCRRDQARRALSELRKEACVLIPAILSSIVAALVGLESIHAMDFIGEREGEQMHLDVLLWVTRLVDAFSNEIFALVQSGTLRGGLKATSARVSAEQRRSRCWEKAASKWRSQLRERGKEVSPWDQSVHELAGRGVSLSALLDFYLILPQLMSHYDPEKSTTNDVVREALIPFTATKRCAAVSILMNGQYVRPTKLVTHAWTNLFRDLVASIIADALGESEYQILGQMLTEDFDCLQRWVSKAGVGNRTYWICAFSVNQHKGICATNPLSTKDTVTGLVHRVCACGLRKAFNDEPPLSEHGRSVPCEMNKFDDMIRYLSATDKGFGQVVAIDPQFKIFTRAWCVAELATGSETGLLQNLKIRSAEDLNVHEDELRCLQIQDMEASRPEDKEQILNSIEDVNAFNDSLVRTLFYDLFPAWASLDPEERMERAGNVIRWQQTSAWRPQ